MTDKTPDPPKGRLKVFFGMAPGVGKTHTMLKVARELQETGLEVVIGALEAHGRPETEALAEGFEVLPGRTLPSRGVFLEEFDLAAALARKPRLLLMDDLAHVNVQGSLHQKRWQDVWDLLDAGIDVYATMNVQSLESLRDVVARITGLVVRDSVPDTILKRADEIEIVDIPPDELIQRLKEGKVHVPEQAQHAVGRFFRKGNLLALRELALRRVAEHVDADMRRYMADQSIAQTWAASERLLVCISPREESSRLIRAAKRMAESLDAPWMVVYVENARALRHSAEERARLEDHLRLAERLGGETVVTQGGLHIAQDIVNLATSRNVSKILLGKPRKGRWRQCFAGSLLGELVRRCGDIDVLVVTGEPEPGEERPTVRHIPRPRLAVMGHVAWAAAAVAAATAVGLLLAKHFEISEIVMVYLLAILAVGLRFGRSASLAASVLSAVALDVVFLPPALSFEVNDLKHLGTFTMLLVVGYIIGNLVERVHAQTRLARGREQRILALFRFAADLAHTGVAASTVESAVRSVARQFQSEAAIFLPGPDGRLQDQGAAEGWREEGGVAQWAFDHQEPAGLGTDILPWARAVYLPLTGTRGVLGVLGVRPEGVPRWMEPDQRHLLEAFATQTALALERAALAEKTLESQRHADREHARDRLLSTMVQEFQASLQDLAGIAGGLEQEDPARARERGIRDHVHRLQRLIDNLATMNRLESASLLLRKEQVSLGKAVASAMGRLESALGGRPVKVELPPSLPSVPADAELLGCALVNIVENAHRYSPADQSIEIKGWATDRSVTLAVTDHGPGIPPGDEERIFGKFVRMPQGRTLPGAGLGLAIAKGVIEAHGGWIQAGTRPSGGAQILASLPIVDA